MATAERALKGELIELELTERHAALMADFRGGLAHSWIALYWIRTEKTYRAEGYEKFQDFLADLSVGKSEGYDMARAGPAMERLEADERTRGLITALDQIRPVLKMKKREDGKWVLAPEKVVAVVQMAMEEAKETRADGRPRITRALIEQVASDHFDWRRKPKKKPEDPGNLRDQVARILENLDLMLHQLTPAEWVIEFGDPSEIERWNEVIDRMTDIQKVYDGEA